jgi:hypothetical protein
MEEFLEKNNSFAFSKKAKVLFFDQNLQSPLYFKKLAARFDGEIKFGVTDDYKIAKKYNAFYDSLLLMEYDFLSQSYKTQKISFDEGN